MQHRVDSYIADGVCCIDTSCAIVPFPYTEDAYRIDAEIDNEVVGLDILDTAGQEVFSAVRDRYMRDGEGFLLVYSLIERTTFVPMSKISEQIKRVKDTDRHVPVVLVGNKVRMDNLSDLRIIIVIFNIDFCVVYTNIIM